MAMARMPPEALDRHVNRVARNGMRVVKKAEAMLDLWASVKRARDHDVPRDDHAGGREARERGDVDPLATEPERAAE